MSNDNLTLWTIEFSVTDDTSIRTIEDRAVYTEACIQVLRTLTNGTVQFTELRPYYFQAHVQGPLQDCQELACEIYRRGLGLMYRIGELEPVSHEAAVSCSN